jgi:hypothetical protein
LGGENVKKPGMSMIETLLAGSMTIFIIVIASNSNRMLAKVGSEALSLINAQIQARSNLSNVTRKVRNSGSMYFLPASYFETYPEKKYDMDPNYCYIVVEPFEDFFQLVHYTPPVSEIDTAPHNRVIIASSPPGYQYKITLNKDISTGDITGFNFITVTPSGKSQISYTSLSSINAEYVEDCSGTEEEVIILYRPEGAVFLGAKPIVVDFIIENSYKMLERPNGNESVTPTDTREYIMRCGVTKLIETIGGRDNIYVAMQGFHRIASEKQNLPPIELNAGSNFSIVLDLFSPSDFVNNLSRYVGVELDPAMHLKTAAGSNIGDGIRMAGFKMKKQLNDIGLTNSINYGMLLTTGNPDTATYAINSHGLSGVEEFRIRLEMFSAAGAEDFFYLFQEQLVIGDDISDMNVDSTVTPNLGVYSSRSKANRERGIRYAKQTFATIKSAGFYDQYQIVLLGYEVGLNEFEDAMVAGHQMTVYPALPTQLLLVSEVDDRYFRGIGEHIIQLMNDSLAPDI